MMWQVRVYSSVGDVRRYLVGGHKDGIKYFLFMCKKIENITKITWSHV